MKIKFILTILTSCAIALSSAMAQDEKADKNEKPDKGGAKEEKGRGKGKAFDPIAIFKLIDANDDGKITPKELGDSKRFKDANRKEVGEAFQGKDVNGDGAITPREFVKTFGPDKGGKGKGKGKGG